MKLPSGEPLRYDMGPEFRWDGNVPENLYPKKPMQQNDISITITQDAEDDVLAKAEVAFDQKSDNYMHQRTDLVLPNVDLPEYDKDGASTESIKRTRAKVGTIDTMLADTLIVLGSNRLDADLKFYHYLEFIADSGAAGAAEIHADLKATYPGRNKPKATPPPPATP